MSRKEERISLSNGVEMPTIGINTYRVSHEEAYSFVDSALAAGYRLFDTASTIGNEVALKNAFKSLLPKYNLDRSEIFITSQLATGKSGTYKIVKKEVQKTLSNLGLEYLDLYLINYPDGGAQNLRKTWGTFKALYDEGCVSAIGVVNYNVHHIRDVSNKNSAPMVNQIEWNPLIHDDRLHSYCLRHDIALQSHSPLGMPYASEKSLLNYPLIKNLASKYEVTASQVVLMWSLQKDVAVLPMTTNAEQMKQNIEMNFKISSYEISMIDAIAKDFSNPDEEM